MQLTLGPVLYHWQPEHWRDFYFRIADEAPVDTVVVGEAVCSKRTPFKQDHIPAVVERLEAAGKRVLHASLILVSLPRERRQTRELMQAAEAEVEIGPVDANAQALPPLRILVADDNPINQTVARAVLEASGAVVETAADGAQALDRLRLSAFDVVLMDVHMPTMDGVEAVGRIRDGQAGRSDVPVIALTADAMAGEEARLKAMGFDALQHKPVQPAALIGAISLALAGRSARAEGSDAAA